MKGSRILGTHIVQHDMFLVVVGGFGLGAYFGGLSPVGVVVVISAGLVVLVSVSRLGELVACFVSDGLVLYSVSDRLLFVVVVVLLLASSVANGVVGICWLLVVGCGGG